MGQKTNPIGNRLGFIRGWDSNWYGGKDYTDKLVEDDKIRTYLMARLRKASVSNIIIERTLKLVTVTIKSARPGVIIGKGGSEVDKLREELKRSRAKKFKSTFLKSSAPSWMRAWWRKALRGKLKLASATVVQSKWPLQEP